MHPSQPATIADSFGKLTEDELFQFAADLKTACSSGEITRLPGTSNERVGPSTGNIETVLNAMTVRAAQLQISVANTVGEIRRLVDFARRERQARDGVDNGVE